MRSTSALLILVLMTIQIYSLKFDISSFAEVQEMNNDPYTNSLISTINTELTAKGGKIESIQNLIRELYTKLVADQSRANREWYERERFLNITISDTNTLILRLSDQIASAQKKLAQINIKILRATTNIKQYSLQFNQEAALLSNLRIKRNLDIAIFNDNMYNHQNLLLALDQVMIALRKLRGSVSGVGRPSHVEAGRNEMRDTNWKKEHGGALLQIFSEDDINNFVQVATEADQDALSKLLTLLETLKRSVQKSLIDDENDEKKSLILFKQLEKQLESDLEHLSSSLIKQKRNLKAYESLRNELTVEINEKTNLRKKNLEYVNQTIELRRTEKSKYDMDTRGRNREKGIISRLERIVNEKLAKMQEFVRRQVDQ